MKEASFRKWLESEYTPASAATRLSSARAVEDAYGDLDEHIENGTIEELLRNLRYSKSDERHNKPNPTRIVISGNPYNRLNNCKTGVRSYVAFIEGGGELEVSKSLELEAVSQALAEKKDGQQFKLEAHLQEALRNHIDQLEPGLEIVDGGSEFSVSSGEIDITAKDHMGATVVIELKRGMARREAIGQITGYMGDLIEEEDVDAVRGILIAADFDKSCLAATRVIQDLKLMRYRFDFLFETVEK